MIEIKTVRDLRKYLDQMGYSPETFAKKVAVSNMTLRRLLSRDEKTVLPEKYRNLFQLYLQESTPVTLGDYEKLLIDLTQKGAEPENQAKISDDVTEKLRLMSYPEELLAQLRKLKNILKTSKSPSVHALVVGALMYFVNPADLIPDLVIGAGLLDDLGIFWLVLRKLGPKAAT